MLLWMGWYGLGVLEERSDGDVEGDTCVFLVSFDICLLF